MWSVLGYSVRPASGTPATVTSKWDDALGYIPAVFEDDNQSAIIPASKARSFYAAGVQLIADYVKTRAFNQVYLVESTPEEPHLHRSVGQRQETLANISTHSLSRSAASCILHGTAMKQMTLRLVTQHEDN